MLKILVENSDKIVWPTGSSLVLVVHTCLIQKMRKVRLRLREMYSLARWNPMESYSSLCIRTYDVILLEYTCVPGFCIGGHFTFSSRNSLFKSTFYFFFFLFFVKSQPRLLTQKNSKMFMGVPLGYGTFDFWFLWHFRPYNIELLKTFWEKLSKVT